MLKVCTAGPHQSCSQLNASCNASASGKTMSKHYVTSTEVCARITLHASAIGGAAAHFGVAEDGAKARMLCMTCTNNRCVL